MQWPPLSSLYHSPLSEVRRTAVLVWPLAPFRIGKGMPNPSLFCSGAQAPRGNDGLCGTRNCRDGFVSALFRIWGLGSLSLLPPCCVCVCVCVIDSG
ncbi:hypothetical protein BO99DRAFT_246125 [Aspergillus violaceofuscus CBS 115571]|uniref:Uncharacterized protein n=1 Tax=Aspergillus violaceofuscus (strain CBS 115571) TaxID=1450538 RepID=A0A2V5I7N6_ASPV1|nr:hypothetical protein BO99DRAFT_246125 [Aspergillus violaceofuscus CBS 115571]